jgi:hypothetical protein
MFENGRQGSSPQHRNRRQGSSPRYRRWRHSDNKNKTRVLLAGAATLGGLTLTGVGVYAGLNAVATGTESVNSGTISLTIGADGNSAGLPQTLSSIAPGDVYNTYVALTNGVGLASQNLTMAVSGSPSNSTLISPPAGDGTTGLEVAVTQCSVAWTVTVGSPGSGTCSGTSTPVLAATAMSSLGTPVTLVAGTVPPGGVWHLQLQVTLPSSLNETTTNGTVPSPSIQGQSVAVTYTFSESQRAGTITNS